MPVRRGLRDDPVGQEEPGLVHVDELHRGVREAAQQMVVGLGVRHGFGLHAVQQGFHARGRYTPRHRPVTPGDRHARGELATLRAAPADLAVPAHRNEVHAVERAGVADPGDEVARELDAGGRIALDRAQPRVGHGELRDVGGDLARHRHARHDHDARVHRTVELDAGAPLEQLVEREPHLREQEVGVALPLRQRPGAGRRRRRGTAARPSSRASRETCAARCIIDCTVS